MEAKGSDLEQTLHELGHRNLYRNPWRVVRTTLLEIPLFFVN